MLRALPLVVLLFSCADPDARTSENLPDMPVFPSAELREAVVGEELDPTEYYVVTTAGVDEVLAWYSEHMADAGWIAHSDPSDDFVFYHTQEGCYGFVGAFVTDGGEVELQLSQQKPGTRCYVYLTPDPSGGID